MLSKKKFKAWLERYPQDTSVVGWSLKHESCPIARFLGETTDAVAPIVRPHSWIAWNHRRSHRMPQWATTFVKLVDHWGQGKPVPKQVALRLLETS